MRIWIMHKKYDVYVALGNLQMYPTMLWLTRDGGSVLMEGIGFYRL